uniref:BC031353 protein, putative n=1 Tax=Brugia malayi TaxID=6279 RepID=A8QC81_BRUMA
MLLENDQTVKLLVVQSLLPTSERSTETEFTIQAVPPSPTSRRETLPRRSLIASAFRFMSTASKSFSKTTGLPLHSSPAPFNRSATKFVANESVKSTRNRERKTAEEQTRAHILPNMPMDDNDNNLNCYGTGCIKRNTSSSSGLLCNFEESALNGRLEPIISLDGFHLQIGKLKVMSR